MLFSIKRTARALAVAAGALAVAAGPAQAKTLANPYDCTPGGDLAQSFRSFGDGSLYTPVEHAGLEGGASGWTLTGGATVVQDNEPWHIAGAGDRSALTLPPGSTAVTAPLCIDATYPYFRLFARAAARQTLKVEVLAYDTKGKLLSTTPYTYRSLFGGWAPTPTIGISVFDLKPAAGVPAAPVAFRFTPLGSATFTIDDVYVDPWMRH
jgi:hypothetical protein